MASISSREDSSLASPSLTNATSRSPSLTIRPRTSKSRPRTAATSSVFHDNEIICAVSEGRGISPTVGLSFVNLSTCEAVLCQFADTQTYARTCHKIMVFDPSNILIIETAKESKLVSIIEDNLIRETSGPDLTYLNRRYWSDADGHDYIQQLAFPADLESLKLSLVGQYFATCCFAAVLKYIDLQLGKIFASKTLRIKFEPSEGAMMIDASTIVSLELVQNLQNSKSKDCLFGLLNQTRTRMGNRMLKSNILQPSTDGDKILKRYKAVRELSSKEGIFFAVRDALEGFVDTDKTLAALVVIQNRVDFAYIESSVNNVLMLKSFVDSIIPVFQALTGAESEELQMVRELCDLENYIQIQELLDYALNEDVRYSTQPEDLRNQRVYALKTGVNGFLDMARTTYKEIRGDIEEITTELTEEHQISLQLKFDPARQFYFRIKAVELEDREIPEVFVNIFRKKGWIECQTLEIMKLNQRHRDAHTEVISLSDASIQKLIDEVRPELRPLFKISESIALLDMLASFAQLVTTQNYIEPEILERTLAIKAGRHAIREKIQSDKFIPNDVYATPQKRFQIITGCNMSGKSTYIRSISLTIIMAQIGCFVPAEYAGLPITQQLFARVSTDDSIEANVSTFASEMREMAFILRTVEPRSLVIVDELGRGTGTTDGLAIAIAIAEALIESRAFVWFVTHFRDLPRVLAERAGAVSLHLQVDVAPDLSRMKMMYKIAPGHEEQKFYGLAIARVVGLPGRVYDVAAEVSRYLHRRNEARKSSVKTLAVAKRRRLVLALREEILLVRDSKAENGAVRLYLRRLQEEFLIRMSAIDAEVAMAEHRALEVESDDALERSVVSDDVGGDDVGLVDDDVDVEMHGVGGRVDDPIEVSSTYTSTTESEETASAEPVERSRGPLFVSPVRIKREPGFPGGELAEDVIEDV